MIYFRAGNPSPDFEGSARHGINLFSDSLIALDLKTGKLKWYFQGVHHEIWDKDFMTTPLLFDVSIGGRTVKAVAATGKVWWPYFFNRETGEALNPIVETPVPIATDVPGEQPWPTQPIPHNARGVQMEPFCFTYPLIADPKEAPRVRTMYHPFSSKEFLIVPSGSAGFGGNTFSPRTGLFYVQGSCGAGSTKVKPVGDTLKPGPGPDRPGFVQSNAGSSGSSVRRANTLSAYNAVSGEQVWRTDVVPGPTGLIATATDLIFQVTSRGEFRVFDAKSGKQLATFGTKESVSASPLMYQVNGKQFVAVVAGDAVHTFGLP
jgi:glucose dehydrogenase